MRAGETENTFRLAGRQHWERMAKTFGPFTTPDRGGRQGTLLRVLRDLVRPLPRRAADVKVLPGDIPATSGTRRREPLAARLPL